MDASIMASDLRAGGVVGIEDVQHPIAVARRVMEHTRHVILSGKLAAEFAHSEGFPRFDPRTREKVEAWLDIMEQFKKKTSYEQIFHVDQYLKEGKHDLGTYCCPHGGVSCTGVGEKIIVLSLAKEVANFLRFSAGATAQEAVNHGMRELSSVNGDGGLICIDARGNIGYGFNTSGMTMHHIG